MNIITKFLNKIRISKMNPMTHKKITNYNQWGSFQK